MEGIEPSSESLEDFCSTVELHELAYYLAAHLHRVLEPSVETIVGDDINFFCESVFWKFADHIAIPQSTQRQFVVLRCIKLCSNSPLFLVVFGYSLFLYA
jgi:hypothetical protein